MKILSYEDLRERGLVPSRQHLCRLINAGRFPRPIKVTPGRNGWTERQIEEHLAALTAAARTAAAKRGKTQG
jgi:predicted DNA-binding transcriptional regulator AlpA